MFSEIFVYSARGLPGKPFSVADEGRKDLARKDGKPFGEIKNAEIAEESNGKKGKEEIEET